MTFHDFPKHSKTFHENCKLDQSFPKKKSSQERTQGPIRYNVATGKLTFGDYHYKPDAEGK